MALEATQAAATRRNYNANIVSTTQDEAQEKLAIGGQLWASIPAELEPMGFRPIKYQDSQDKLAFHLPPYTSTITSKPGTAAIRGGRKDMYYDEAAFIKEFPALYQAGLPAITRGQGRITVVSTPFGESGLYHELWNEVKWSHHKVPWWESRFMVKGALNPDGSPNYEPVIEATSLAPEMGTMERVDAFGSEKLQEILHSGLRDDLVAFQTEYECMFVDEAEAYYPWDLVISTVQRSLPVWKNWPEGFQWEGEGLSIGVDLAKERDSTVFTVVGHRIGEDGGANKRILYTYETQADYADQFIELVRLTENTRARRVSIDATGPGQMFFERAQREGLGTLAHIEGISFTNAKKEEWATRFKADLQDSRVVLPNNKRLLDQIHGIKRTRTPNNFFKFAGAKDDYFWSLMLAMYGHGSRPVKFYRLGR